METIQILVHDLREEIAKDALLIYAFLLPHFDNYQTLFIATLQNYILKYKKSKFRAHSHQLLLYINQSEHKILISAGVFTVLALIFTLFFFMSDRKPKRPPMIITSNKRNPYFISPTSGIHSPMYSSISASPTPSIGRRSRSSSPANELKRQIMEEEHEKHVKKEERVEEYNYLPKTPNSLFPPGRPTGLTEAQENAFKKVTSGTVLIKHGRMGTRHIRFVYVSEDLKYICWRPLGAINEVNSLPLATFISIDIGGTEQTLRCQESCLMSLVGKSPIDRTLYFEFAYFPTLDENIEAASDWGEALGICMESMKDIQKALVSSPSRMTSFETTSPSTPGQHRKVSSPTISPSINDRHNNSSITHGV